MHRHNLVDGLQITSKKVDGKCELCIFGKSTHRPFDEKLTHETKVLEHIHLDLFGLTRTQSIGGAIWMFLATDGRSSVKAPSFLTNKQKETVLAAVHDWRTMAERQTGLKVLIFRIDGGGEFDNGWFRDYCRKHGIVIEMIPPRSSAANGVAERANRTVLDGVRTFLVDAGFPPSMWAKAALTFCYVNVFIPSSRFPNEVPIEIYTKKRHDVSHLRPFGCKCWVTLDAIQTDGKLGVRAVKGRFVGYIGRRGYRVWLPQTKTFHESRSVEFEEGDPRRSAPAVPDEVDGEVFVDVNIGPAPNAVPDSPANENQIDIPNASIPSTPTTPSTPSYDGIPELFAAQPSFQPLALPIQEPEAGPRRGTRIREPSARQLQSEESTERERSAFEQNLAWAHDSGGIDELDDNPLAMVANSPFAFGAESSDKWVPNTYKQAIRHPELWKAPMQAEYDTLMDKNCWTLVDLPRNANLTGGRWVYAIKWSKDGQVAKRKARYVAQGFTQIEGVDYNKTYGAVARMESVRIVLAVIAVLGLFMFQVDFKAAFLNSPIQHDVYIKQPEGFVKEGEEHKVCKLNKSIYGTMQGSHDWQDMLGKGYEEDGYIASKADPCVRYRRIDNEYTLSTTYGDDVNGASSTEDGRKKAIADLGKRWESSEVNSGILLGMTISQDPISKSITISQKSYFERMLEHFGMENVRIRCTPLDPKAKIIESTNPLPELDRKFMSNKPYRSFVGSLLWGACSTRPDIAFASNFFARFQLNPGIIHWEACEWLAGYIRGTIHYSITYRAPKPGDDRLGFGLAPLGYSDSDWASCLVTR
ncbi:hypothetical protein HHX47_DHR10000136 [Lentinula edodes]|nr:hypothetical protein HHX47_DHR10000136 [Lentinula edodes]